MSNEVSYYEDFYEIEKKIWLLLNDAVKNRNSPFRIPVFICGEQSDFDGRIVVIRKADKDNKILQFHSDIRSDKIKKLPDQKKDEAINKTKANKILLLIIID